MRAILKIAERFYFLIKKATYEHTVNDRILNINNLTKSRCPQYCQSDLISQADSIMSKIQYLNTHNKKEINNLYLRDKSLFAEVNKSLPSIQRWNEESKLQREENIENNTFVGSPNPVPPHLISGYSERGKTLYKKDEKSKKQLESYQKKVDEYWTSFGSKHYYFIISMQKDDNPNKDLLDLQTFRPKWEDFAEGKGSLDFGKLEDFNQFYNDCVRINAIRAEKNLIPKSEFSLKKNRNKFYLLKIEQDSSAKEEFINFFDTELEAKKYAETYFVNNANEISLKKDKNKKYNILFRIGKIVHNKDKLYNDIEKVSEINFEDWKKEAVEYRLKKTIIKSNSKTSEKLPDVFYSYKDCAKHVLDFFNQNELKILEETEIDKDYNIEFDIFKLIKNQDAEKIVSINFESWYLMETLDRENLMLEKQAFVSSNKKRMIKRTSIFTNIINKYEKY